MSTQNRPAPDAGEHFTAKPVNPDPVNPEPVSNAPETRGGVGKFAPSAVWRGELRGTFHLAWPMVATQVGTTAMSITDAVMMGWLGPRELAAGSLAANLMFPCLFVAMGVISAVSAMAAQELAARNPRGVRRTVRQGFWVAVVMILPIWTFLWFGPDLLTAMGQDPRNAALAGDYLSFAMWSLLPAMWFLVLRNFAAALSRPRAALWINCFGVVVNGIGNYAFMFGEFGMPRLELVGVGLSSLILQIFMLACMVVLMLRDRQFRRFAIFGRWWRSDWQRFRDILWVGLPIGMTILAEAGLFAATTHLMGLVGTAELAGHAIALQCVGLSFMVPMGVAQAATVRVGYAVGKRDWEAIGRAGSAAYVIGLGFMVLASFAMLLGGEMITALFLDVSQEDAAIAAGHAVGFLVIAAFFQLADGAQVLALGCLRGLKDTRVPMILAIVGYWGVGLPVAVALTFWLGFGGAGLWIGLAMGLGVTAAALSVRFFWRDWFVGYRA